MIRHTGSKSRLTVNFHLIESRGFIVAGSHGFVHNPLSEGFVALNLGHLVFQSRLGHHVDHVTFLWDSFYRDPWVDSRDGAWSSIVHLVENCSLCGAEIGNSGRCWHSFEHPPSAEMIGQLCILCG